MKQQTEALLEDYLHLCQEAEDTLRKEQGLLKQNGPELSQSFLDEKASLLSKIAEATQALKSIRASQETLSADAKELAQSIQGRLIKLLVLDRHNEQLLLKATMERYTPEEQPKASVTTIERLYLSGKRPPSSPPFNTASRSSRLKIEEGLSALLSNT